MIWIYTVCKVRVYPGSAGLGLRNFFVSLFSAKLAVGKSGLDIIFALDVSASIGAKSLDTAKDFIKLLVKEFGVSPRKDGGKYVWWRFTKCTLK